jgi:hypothetical protein
LQNYDLWGILLIMRKFQVLLGIMFLWNFALRADSYSLLDLAVQNQPLVMTQGNSYYYTLESFYSLPVIGSTSDPRTDFLGVDKIWAPDYPSFEDALLSGDISNKIEIWNTTDMSQTPLFVFTSDPGVSILSGVGSYWGDNGVAYRITMLNGNLNADEFKARGVREGVIYQETLSFVPEPSALSLIAVGLGGLALVRRRRS